MERERERKPEGDEQIHKEGKRKEQRETEGNGKEWEER